MWEIASLAKEEDTVYVRGHSSALFWVNQAWFLDRFSDKFSCIDKCHPQLQMFQGPLADLQVQKFAVILSH